MKAITYSSYGAPEVLQMKEVNAPTPGENEILVKLHATAANSGDVRLRKADPWAVRLFFGLTKPRINILGGVLSGEIVSTGKNVTKFKEGDQVFGSTGMSFGTYAEYKSLSQDGLVIIKPDNISHEQAATIPFGAFTALHFIKKANIKAGQKVLIYGASGAVGSAAVQLAKSFGAEVTAVCSTSNTEMVTSIGADKVVDYTREDFTKNGELYDVVFETVNKLPFRDGLKSLKKGGTLILGSASFSEMFRGAWVSMTTSRKVLAGPITQKQEALKYIKGLVEKGKYTAIVDRVYPLDQMVDAHTYVEMGHKKGNVAIRFA